MAEPARDLNWAGAEMRHREEMADRRDPPAFLIVGGPKGKTSVPSHYVLREKGETAHPKS